MQIFYLLFLIALLIISVILYYNNLNQKRALQSITKDLQKIVEQNTDEKIMIITDEKCIQEMVAELNSLLNAQQKLRADNRKSKIQSNKMLSNVSHDIKTPLTTIVGCIEVLGLSKDISDKDRELVGTITKKSTQVLNLINKFFDLAKIEAGDYNIPLEKINLNDVCSRNLLGFYEMLESDGFTVNVELPEVQIYIMGNHNALDRILNNLLSNSVKHGGSGKYLGLNLRYDDDWVYVDVCDKGDGMDEKYSERIFERLYTLDDSRSKCYENSGLGLTITKRLVEEMHGMISLTESRRGSTVFTIQFPRLAY